VTRKVEVEPDRERKW